MRNQAILSSNWLSFKSDVRVLTIFRKRRTKTFGIFEIDKSAPIVPPQLFSLFYFPLVPSVFPLYDQLLDEEICLNACL